jgi:hypothetical protein
MNHSEAIESAAAAAYTLRELSGPERDAFELHFIDCPICAEEVWAGNRMFAAGREFVKSDKRKVIPFPVRWFPARAVAAVFAAVIGIQSFLLWRPQPLVQAITTGPTLAETMRAGEEIEKVHFEGDLATSVGLGIQPDLPYPNYRIEVRDSSEKVLKVVHTTAKEIHNGQGFSLLLGPLPAGRYVVVVEGVREDGNRLRVSTFPFVVE